MSEFATAALVQQSCMATICISIFYVITAEKEVKNLSLSFTQQSNVPFAPAAKNCISINLLSITKHTHMRLNPEMLILQRMCQKIYLLFRTSLMML